MARKQTMKVYHGVPKSIIDAHTIFYSSFDGKIDATVGDIIDKPSLISFKPMNTGYGISSNSGISYKIKERKSIYSSFSLNFWLNITEFYNISSDYPEIITLQLGNKLNKATSALKIYFSRVSSRIYCEIYTRDNYRALTIIPNVKHDSRLPDICHIRIDSDGDFLTPYYNGMKQPSLDLKSETTFREFDSVVAHSSRLISDLHISNIDRGDYFPNLPQDFIEGKAIIKPRMGQQQIKGDPMYSQVTTLKVPCTGQNSGWDIPVDNNMTQSSINPEVSVSSSEYTTGEKIRIKALNGEIIGGIIDSDTALATVIKESTSGDSPDIITYLDDVSKFEVNDTVNILRPNNTIMGNHTGYTITEIDKNNKSVKLNSVGIKTVLYYPCKLIETTTSSSSSPLVKTNDGKTVNGAWTGLGTNVATFTLGDNNPSLQGKDLYVDYSLTMPCGNSDFSELPHTVERAWGENGVEMKPVNTITIVDDFKGKITGSIKVCPHMAKYIATPDLILPHTQSINFTEFTYDQYSRLGVLDGSNSYVVNNKNKNIPQQIFSFNLIEIVERKLGCPIPSINKVQWLKDNLDPSATIEHHGYGITPTGENSLSIAWYNSVMNNWTVPGGNHTSNTVTKLENVTSAISNRIDNNGFVHILVYTSASDGVNYSKVYTDYICLKIMLKIDSSYTTLYCENKRAREDKCNPVLVQKQTKTVKRYLPSRECFTTECKYVDMKRTKLNTDGELLTKLYENGKIYSTTQGSGSYLTHTASRYKNITNILKLEAVYPYTFYNESLYRSPLLNLMTFSNQLTDTNINNGTNTKFMPIECYDIPRYLVFKPYISIHDNEIRLYIYSSLLTKNTTSTQYTHSASLQALHVYDIPNRPLIK